jgi:cellobiose phosphorylase
VDPGYIKGYVPGLRENGGQYTHASVWVLMAQAARGNAAEVSRLLRMLNPANRSASTEGARRYRVEPYVLAADIYSGEGIAGRGGWTWYTGAAGWMYRAILESVLGVRVRGDELWLDPCVPDHWPGFEVELDLPGTFYLVRVERGSAQPLLDGKPVAGPAVPLLRDGRRHTVEFFLS